MTDVHTPLQRSYNMSRIRATNTRPEVALRKALWHTGLRYRISAKLPGKPDLTFQSAKVVVFVDGCYWHSCPKHFVMPRSNVKFWKEKIARNIARDKLVTKQLRRSGWLVIRFWEHDIDRRLSNCVSRIAAVLRKRHPRS